MSLQPTRFIDRGIDYLTCSFNTSANWERLYRTVAKVERYECRHGGIVQNWGMSGYMGHRVGGLEYGSKHDSVIVRLSGMTAGLNWWRFAESATNISRIDVQETVTYSEDPGQTILRHFEELRSHCAKRKKFPQPKMWTGLNGPETVYSGKRVSDTMLRIYHRGSRPGHSYAVGHLRYEAEIKNAPARLLASALLRSKNPELAASLHCHRLFTRRGVELWPLTGLPITIKCPRPPTTVQKRLRWIEVSVRPAVKELLGCSHTLEVCRALFGDELAQDVARCLDKDRSE